MIEKARRWLLVPIETKAREFDGKVLFSCVAAEAGYGVILGHKAFTKDIGSKPRGILVDKSVFVSKSRLFHRNRKLGNRGVAWCEEGLVMPSTRRLVRWARAMTLSSSLSWSRCAIQRGPASRLAASAKIA